MGKYRLLLKSTAQKQKSGIIGIFLLVSVLALCLFSALTVYISGTNSVETEMNRLGFGDFTIWTSGQSEDIKEELENIPDVERVSYQPLIFAGYEINGGYSDNEGQLIVYDGSVDYRFINEDGEELPTPEIQTGTVYISPALQSMFDVKIGDTIQFELSHSNGIKSLTVAGYFADAFMGSSMIDMKSFLICAYDWSEIQSVIEEASIADKLGRVGAMFHIFKSENSALSDLEFQRKINESTDVSLYTEFTYRKDSILNYMLLLQNILSGFLIAFSAVLLIICIVITGHSLSTVIEQEKRDMAVLKTMGMSGSGLRGVYLALYGGTISAGLLLGLEFSFLIAELLAKAMITSTGMLIELSFPIVVILPILLGILLVFAAFLFIRTARILKIAPMQTIREATGEKSVKSPLSKRFLTLGIAVRELRSEKRKYIALCVISAFLALFLSVIGKMGTWLGPNGEGLMNTFSVADHDLGVQPFNETVPMDEIERVINWYSPVLETYELAMQSVTVNGQEYTANVLNDTKWFHVLSGEVCGGESILITDTVASELQLSIGDTVRVAANGRAESYTVSGIYQCANGMGSNIGMSLAGYSKIGNITGYIWCYHYILENGQMRDFAMKYLQDNYRGIDVHTNSWSGLSGIVFVMHALIVVIYLIAALFVLVTVALTVSKLLQSETAKMAIYKSLGLSSGALRLSFALRFLIVVFIGTVIGLLVSALFGDIAIASLFKMFGICEFGSGFSVLGTILPLVSVPLLFFVFALAFSAKLKRVSIVKLISENDD
ncbi:MAG: ABC transporter permease [Oscillospiraceae bacterium]|nr:ABC transporter permease [Oscillospiraceae bacterium]